MRISRTAVLVLVAAAAAVGSGHFNPICTVASAAAAPGGDVSAAERSSPQELKLLGQSAETLEAGIKRSGLTAANVASAGALAGRLEKAGGGYFPFADDLTLAAKASRPRDALTALAGISKTLGAALRRAPGASEAAAAGGAGNERKTLKGIFASGGYNVDLTPPAWTLTDAIKAWILRLWQRLADLMSGSGGGILRISRAFLAVVLFLIIAAAVLAALWYYAQYRDRRRAHEFQGEPVEGMRMDAPEAHEQRARELVARGEYRLALQQVFLALLAHLERLKLVTYDRSRTNMEYAGDFARRTRDGESTAGMRAIVRAYDRAWYGGAACGSDDVRDFDLRTMALVERVKRSSSETQ